MIVTIDNEKLRSPENASIYRGAMYFQYLFGGLLDDCNVWMAGGCFRSYFSKTKIEDVDFFTTDRDECARLVWKLRSIGWKCFFKNKNALKGFVIIKGKRVDVDIVKRFYENEEQCLIDFDFSVSKFAYNTKTKSVFYSANFFADLSMKKLVVPDENFGNPLGSLKRLQKYINKGFYACNGTLLTIAKRLSTIDMNDPANNEIEFYPDGTTRIILFD